MSDAFSTNPIERDPNAEDSLGTITERQEKRSLLKTHQALDNVKTALECLDDVEIRIYKLEEELSSFRCWVREILKLTEDPRSGLNTTEQIVQLNQEVRAVRIPLVDAKKKLKNVLMFQKRPKEE